MCMEHSSNLPPASRDTFSTFHPAVTLLYFVLTIGTAILLMHPVILCISFIAAFSYTAHLGGIHAVKRSLIWVLPAAFLIVLVNAMFQHRGITVLLYLPSGNPLTLESILYGLAAAGMMLAVMLWFQCYHAIMTSDRFVYLFGRISPVLSLLLSMTLRFVPLCYTQFQNIREAQRSIGRDFTEGTVLKRMQCAVTMLSILFTWAVENAIITADSMKSRGYGLPGRSAFSIYSFEKRDKRALCWFLLCGFWISLTGVTGLMNWTYYPALNGIWLHPVSIGAYLCYLALCFTPIYLNRRENRIWERCKSEI